MLSSAIRVLARTAAIQLEEVAAAHAVHSHRPSPDLDRRRPDIKASVGTGSLPPNMVPADGHASQVSAQAQRRHENTEGLTSAGSSGSVGVEGEEKSEEVKEVERKIERLLQRVKKPEIPQQQQYLQQQGDSTLAGSKQGVTGQVDELPDAMKVPGTIRPDPSHSPTGSPTPGHAEKLSKIFSQSAASKPVPTPGPIQASSTVPTATISKPPVEEPAKSNPIAPSAASAAEIPFDTPLASVSTTSAAPAASSSNAAQPEVAEIVPEEEDVRSFMLYDKSSADNPGTSRSSSIKSAIFTDRSTLPLRM